VTALGINIGPDSGLTPDEQTLIPGLDDYVGDPLLAFNRRRSFTRLAVPSAAGSSTNIRFLIRCEPRYLSGPVRPGSGCWEAATT